MVVCYGCSFTAEALLILPQFIRFGTLRSVWVARKPPGFGTSAVELRQRPQNLISTFLVLILQIPRFDLPEKIYIARIA